MYDRLSRYYDASQAVLTEDIPYLLSLAAETGGPVLELGCGSGRLLLPLARAGYTITGIDNSPAMLALADVRLAQEDPEVAARVRLVTADIKQAYLTDEPHTFALVVMGVNTLMHFTEAEAGSVLRHAAKLLQPGGLLIIDMDNPFVLADVHDEAELALEEEWVDDVSGRTVRQWAAYEPAGVGQAIDVRWVFEETGPDAPEPATVDMRFHYFYPHQLDLLLAHNGLRLVTVYGDYDRVPFDEESDRFLAVARPG